MRVPTAEPWQVVRYLEEHELTPAIYFLFSRRACEEGGRVCLSLPVVPGGYDLARRSARSRWPTCRARTARSARSTLLLRLLPRGVAVHHAGLLPVIKMLVEELFAAGRLRAVFATDTLALGINMPARTVVIGEMSKWDGEQHRLLTPNEYRQMTGQGRAARHRSARRLDDPLFALGDLRAGDGGASRGSCCRSRAPSRPHYSTAVNLWHGPEDRARLADLYARRLRRFQQDSQLEALTREQEQLEDAFNRRAAGTNPRPRCLAHRPRGGTGRAGAGAGPPRAPLPRRERWSTGWARVLARHGYLAGDRPPPRASLLRQIFDTNALTLAELLADGTLSDLRPTGAGRGDLLVCFRPREPAAQSAARPPPGSPAWRGADAQRPNRGGGAPARAAPSRGR